MLRPSSNPVPSLLIAAGLALLLAGCSSKIEKQAKSQVEELVKAREFGRAVLVIQEAIEKEPENLNLKRLRVIVCLQGDNPTLAYSAYKALLAKKWTDKSKPQEFRKSDPVLLEALKNDDAVVRSGAAKVLSSLRETDSVNPLIKALGDKETSVRRAAANALGEIRDKRAVGPLTELLKDSSWFVRGESAQALGKIGDGKAVKPLVALLSDPDNYVRDNASSALTMLATPENKAVFQEGLASPDFLTQFTSALALAKMKDPKAEPVLLQALQNNSLFIRRDAIKGLSNFPTEPSLQAVRAKVQTDPEIEVRCIALIALGAMGDRASAPLFEELIRNRANPPEIRSAAFMGYQKLAELFPDLVK
ncbi:MAG: HEAT repeat domain-containing protein [Verrucomicrobiae bacterium]|nr:HEAT repeat domain-containing protein [Verrucomicrobiae bacterium]